MFFSSSIAKAVGGKVEPFIARSPAPCLPVSATRDPALFLALAVSTTASGRNAEFIHRRDQPAERRVRQRQTAWTLNLETLKETVQVFEFFARQSAVARAAADFVEDFAGFLAVHFFGDLDVVAIAALAIIEAAENVALVAFLAGFGIVLVVEAREFAGAVGQRRHCLLLRFLGCGEVSAAERVFGAFLHLYGAAEQAAGAFGFLTIAAIALRAGTSGLAAAGAAAIGLLALTLALALLLTWLLARLAALAALTVLALLLAGTLALLLALSVLLALTLLLPLLALLLARLTLSGLLLALLLAARPLALLLFGLLRLAAA